jgi:adenosylcobinamide kinase/adenosylcobinamide-phosphate guanylyltransferase
MGGLTFITGGARSGKSSFALREASSKAGRRLFVATLEPRDEEMRLRAELHRAERGPGWESREEPLGLAAALSEAAEGCEVCVVDCLTLWLSNVIHAGRDVEAEIAGLVSALEDAKRHIEVYVVSNEVGMGIVPGNELARRFRDYAGLLNQKVAGAADSVYLMASGIPVRIK